MTQPEYGGCSSTGRPDTLILIGLSPRLCDVQATTACSFEGTGDATLTSEATVNSCGASSAAHVRPHVHDAGAGRTFRSRHYRRCSPGVRTTLSCRGFATFLEVHRRRNWRAPGGLRIAGTSVSRRCLVFRDDDLTVSNRYCDDDMVNNACVPEPGKHVLLTTASTRARRSRVDEARRAHGDHKASAPRVALIPLREHPIAALTRYSRARRHMEDPAHRSKKHPTRNRDRHIVCDTHVVQCRQECGT
jgi:hypothetical protein